MIATARPKRTRLAPEARRDLILDEAARLIQREGLAAATMEGLARECGISKGLVYNYFPTRDALLAALLRREQEDLRDRGMATALQAGSFPDLIRQTTRLYLEQTRDRGAMIGALLADPAVARLMEDANRAEHDRTVRYFVRATRRAFGLPLPTAIAAVEMLMSVTGAAGRLVADRVLDVPMAEDMVVRIITGGLAELAEAGRQPPCSA